VDVGVLFSTDPVITEKGFVVLEDDKGSQPAGNIAPMIRQDVVNDEIRSLLNAVSAEITTENITVAIGQVVLEQRDVAEVATEFLQTAGLL
jgi:osmoprotectant transport system substrate-binding protein